MTMDECPHKIHSNLTLDTLAYGGCRVRVDQGARNPYCYQMARRCKQEGGYPYVECDTYLAARVTALEEELVLWRRHTEGPLGVFCEGLTCESATMPCPRRKTCTEKANVMELCRLMDAYDERQREAKKGAE